MNKINPNDYDSAKLAYIGDAVIELLVRERLLMEPAAGIHPSQRALEYVTAKNQSEAVEKILPLLTEEEEGYYRRGRNNVHSNVPKSATALEYRRATGFEALFGYLYLDGQTERMKALFKLAYPQKKSLSEE